MGCGSGAQLHPIGSQEVSRTEVRHKVAYKEKRE
jgi:hypothetical protein